MKMSAAADLEIASKEHYDSMLCGEETGMMTSVASAMMISVATSMMTSVATTGMTSVARDAADKFAGGNTALMTSVAGI